VLERTLPFEASDANFIVLVPAIESAFNGPGQLSQIGRTFSWHASRKTFIADRQRVLDQLMQDIAAALSDRVTQST
jgi:hypothetical protein